MNPLTIEFKNYKLLKDAKFEFDPDSYVYFVLGSNNKGKSSFLQVLLDILQAKSTTPNPVTHGEKEGIVQFDFEASNGSLYTARFEFTDEKGKFVLSSPDAISSSKVTEIRNFFDHHNIIAEDFVKMGNNAKDRKKQRDIFLDLMAPEHRDALLSAEARYAIEYAIRTNTNSKLSALKGTLQTSLTPEDELLLEKKDELEKEKANLEIKKEKASEMSALEVDLSRQKQNKELRKVDLVDEDLVIVSKTECDNIQASINHYKREMEQAQERLANRKQKLIDDTKVRDEKLHAINIEITDIETQIANIPKIEFNGMRVMEIATLLDNIRTVSARAILVKESQGSIEAKQIEWNHADKRVKELSAKCQSILTENAISIPNIVIHSDGLYYTKGEVEVPLVEEQVGTSEIYMITLRILLALNKKTPIIIMGRGESLDNNVLSEINALAEQVSKESGKKVSIIFDRVVPNDDPISLVAYENLEETVKLNINKK